jgi:acyl-CoA thioester hydrolase
MKRLDQAHGLLTPYEGVSHKNWDNTKVIPAPLCLHETRIKIDWVDYNKHLSESCYLLVFGDHSDAFFRYIGIDEAYRESGLSIYTVESHIQYIKEVLLNDPISVTCQVLDVDSKRIHFMQAMYNQETKALLATVEQMLCHVDMLKAKAAPFPQHIYERLQLIHAAHASLTPPKPIGRPIGIRRKQLT